MPGARSHKPACAGIPFAGSDVVPGLPIACPEAADRGELNPPPPPGRLWQGSEQGPRFWFAAAFPAAAVGLCIPCSDPRGCNTKSLSGWRRRLLRRCAVRGAVRQESLLHLQPCGSENAAAVRIPNPTTNFSLHQPVSETKLWLPNIIHVPEEPQPLPQLPPSSRSEHERWTESDPGAGLTTCDGSQQRRKGSA